MPTVRENLFSTSLLGKRVFHFKKIDSTQSYAKKALNETNLSIGDLILSDFQTAGKGTQGRTWHTLKEPQLTFSLVCPAYLSPHKLPIFNLFCSVALTRILSEYSINAGIKWPNDVLIDSKKVAGILSELESVESQPCIIVGLGINIKASYEDFPLDIRQQSTALSFYSDHIDRMKLLEAFLVEIEKYVLEKESTEKLIQYTQNGFQTYSIYKNQKLHVRQNGKKVSGYANQIASDGSLIFQTDQGIKKISHGQILLD